MPKGERDVEMKNVEQAKDKSSDTNSDSTSFHDSETKRLRQQQLLQDMEKKYEALSEEWKKIQMQSIDDMNFMQLMELCRHKGMSEKLIQQILELTSSK
ncbi:hypothetical protein RFI_06412 [Reticulomyxa filosa]|uniref:Uncharacterized protein n=1 Tax=Reticulomyxa filosa TaxID=46433 RepID=X6NXH2_RETFI|nr:hypothetical protein RFI_06412 [Reticulomyxa filosa]|eukprot:ETO30701.1 hypothetical protein RFI_06412 [Reticulomyxa filosa]